MAMALLNVRAAAVVSAAFLLATCGHPGGETQSEAAAGSAPPSQAERRAAQALSIGANPTFAANDSDLDRIILCDIAIEVLQVRLEETPGFDPTMRQAVNEVRETYAKKIDDLARREGISPQKVVKIRADLSKVAISDTVQAQRAISCLNRLKINDQA